MAATIATMAMLNAKCLSINNNSPKTAIPTKTTTATTTTTKPMSLLSMQNLPKGLTNSSSLAGGTAIAGAIFSALSSCEPAMAAQQIAEIAEGDNRGTLLLFVITPAIAWVLFNILQPALNQLNKMKDTKSVIVGLGLGGLAATASSGFMSTPSASAALTDQIAMIGDATSSDNRGTLLLFVVAPAIAWVLYNILQPALNQIDRMRSD